jgi:hypothetical protein
VNIETLTAAAEVPDKDNEDKDDHPSQSVARHVSASGVVLRAAWAAVFIVYKGYILVNVVEGSPE